MVTEGSVLRIYVCPAWQRLSEYRPKEDSQHLRTELDFEAQEFADALAALHGMDLDARLGSPTDVAKRKSENARLEERLRRLSKVYQLGNMEDDQYKTASTEIKAALARLRAEDEPSIRNARRTLSAARDIPWLTASAEQGAAVPQSLFEALFVSPANDHIVAVAPRVELRPFIRDRLYVKRVPKGWAIDADGQVDYESPGD